MSASIVQRKTQQQWERGSEEEQRKAAQALRALQSRKHVSDARDERQSRKETFRQGGRRAVEIVWLPALDAEPGLPHLNSTEDWDPKRKTSDVGRMRLSLARHLFGRYTTPAFLDAMWLRPDNLGRRGGGFDMRFATWYKAIASGASLYKLCAQPKGLLSRKECHHFTKAPAWASPEQAVWWARVMGMKGSQSTADTIARSKLVRFAGDVLETPRESWLSVARFFVAHPEFKLQEMDDILDWVENSIRQDAAWSMRGRTPKTVRESSKAWHKFVLRQREWSRHKWDGLDIPDWTLALGDPDSPHHRIWRVTQIVTGTALAKEGHAMRHCVGSYVGACSSGRSGIFSLTIQRGRWGEPERAVTLEVAKDYRLIQCRGYANRMPHSEERSIIRRWCEAHDLSFGGC